MQGATKEMAASAGTPVQEARGIDQAAVAKAVAQAPEPVLARVLQALGAGTRQEAVGLVRADPEAAKIAAGVLGQEAAPPAQPTAAAAQPPAAGEQSMAERVYPKGGRGAKVSF